MHLGTMSTIANHAPNNYRHIVIKNDMDDPIGDQPTITQNVKFDLIAEGCGYRTVSVTKFRCVKISFTSNLRSFGGVSI